MNFLFTTAFSKNKFTFDEILKFVKDEQFKYLVLESINDKYYGFNLKMKFERKIAKEIVLGNWTVLVNADDIRNPVLFNGNHSFITIFVAKLIATVQTFS
jgi:hypothetical protein